MPITKKFKVYVIFLLIIAITAAYIYFDSFTSEFLVVAILVVLFFLLTLPYISEFLTKLNYRNIIARSKSVKAKIVSVKQYPDSKNTRQIILRLSVYFNDPEKQFLSGYIINKPSSRQQDFATAGRIIDVYFNPQKPDRIIIPEIHEKKKPVENFWVKFREYWGFVFFLPGAVGIFIPVYFLFFNTTKSFEILSYVSGEKETIWEISCSRKSSDDPKGTYYINVIEPGNGKTLKKIKHKNDAIPSDFYIVQNNNKVFVIGAQYDRQPIIDTYDANTFEQLDDIESFILLNPKLKNGIAAAQFFYDSYNYEGFITTLLEITTTDGYKLFYDFQTETFYNSTNDWRASKWVNDSLEIAKNPFAFFLAYDDAYEVRTLYKIESKDPKDYYNIYSSSGQTYSTNYTYLFSDTSLSYKCTNIIPGKYFLNGRIIYHDDSIIAIYHNAKLRKGADWQISGVDKTGKILFAINQSEFPNVEKFIEYYNDNSSTSNFKPTAIRSKDHMVFIFELSYNADGAICVDIKTGKIIWKYEAGK
jgi:hypothetical protein